MEYNTELMEQTIPEEDVETETIGEDTNAEVEGNKIGQGRENAKLYLTEHADVCREIEQKVRAHYGFEDAVAAEAEPKKTKKKPRNRKTKSRPAKRKKCFHRNLSFTVKKSR